MTQPTQATEATLEKIRALLNMAEGTDNPAEAEAFSARAQQLMAKYSVDHAMLHATGKRDERITHLRIECPAPYARDKRGLIAEVALAMDCKAVSHNGRNKAITIIGFRSDVEIIEMMITSLLVQAVHAMAVANVPVWESVAAYRRSFYHGYAIKIGQRIQIARAEAKMDAADANAGTELVWVNREQALQDAMDDLFGKLKNARPRKLQGSGKYDGARAAAKADLGLDGRVTAGDRRALG